MSTKTNFKRIALVAVAALGLGVLSSAPAAQAASTVTLAVTNGTAGLNGARSDSSTAALLNFTGLLGGADTITVAAILKSAPTGYAVSPVFFNLDSATPTTTGVIVETTTVLTALASSGHVFAVASGNTDALDTASASAGFRMFSTSDVIINRTMGLAFDSVTSTASPAANANSTTTGRVPGTYTYSIVVKTFESGNNVLGMPTRTVVTDVNIVISAPATSSVTISPSLSTANLNTASGTAADVVISTAATASATAVGYVNVKTYNASSIATQESVTVTIAGAGTLFFGSTGGSSLVIAGDGTTEVEVRPDGRAGVATITISTPTAAFPTKTLTFYSAAASKMTASVFNPTLGLGANATAVAVTATDASGINWSGAAYIVASAAADALVGGSATTPVLCPYELIADTKTHFCPITTIATGTAKFKVIDAATVALATATSNEVTVTVANAATGSVKLAFNKASYAPGEKAYITVTVLDTAGKTKQGATYSTLFATGGITANVAFGSGSDTLTPVSVTTSAFNNAVTPLTAGAKTYSVFMPTTGGTVKITATGGVSLPLAGQVEVSASTTVVDATAASASAALAAVTALATTVASLKTLITTLTNLVLKIQKKVKA